jgi:NAD(P)H-flavin reductase/ferredoxin
MTTVPIQLVFSDGKSCSLQVERGASVLRASREAGLSLLVDCEEGVCGTCQAQVSRGSVGLQAFNPGLLSEAEVRDGAALLCRSVAQEAAVIELPYASDDARAARDDAPVGGVVRCVQAAASDTLTLSVEPDAPYDFLPGQYANLSPAAGWERSFSMANVPGDAVLTFHVAVRPGGAFSQWLRDAGPGTRLLLSPARGTFFLRDDRRRKVMIAGGTGLAPMLAMLRQIAAGPQEVRSVPVVLLVGARTEDHLFARDELERLAIKLPNLQVRFACDQAAAPSAVRQGRVTDLLQDLPLDREETVYACGPPPMVESVRQRLKALKFPMRRFLSERFTG